LTPSILFRDKRFLVIDKPFGLPVHPGRAGGPSVEGFFPEWRVGRDGPWLAHRLDRDTSGCLLVALKKSALIAAQALFARGAVEKTYWAVVRGAPTAERGVIDLPLGKVMQGRQWKMAPDRGAGAAVTEWEVKGRGDGIAWVEFRPKTGRTHQIRAHAALLGMPIIGDEVYGDGGHKLCLLARRLHLPLDPPVLASANVPAHMIEAMRSCGYAEQRI
jgi:tRNA pseudouridine32 synthase/23S rRNA pseudouridine746 synthase